MTPRNFLALEGLLEENGRFEVRRAYETPSAPRRTTVNFTGATAVVRLLGGEGEEVGRAPVEVRFPQGCGPQGQVGLAQVQAFVPAHPDARTLELEVEGRVVAKLSVGSRAPGVAGPSVKLASKGRTARARWKVDGKPTPEVRLSLVIGGREHPLEERVKGSGATIDLEPWAGRGEASLRVTVTAAFRTASGTSSSFALPPPEVRGRILTPSAGEEWRAGQPRGLLANLMDQNGSPVPWDPQRVFWVLDGVRLGDTRRIADPGEPPSGKHSVSLMLIGVKKNEVRELDRVEFVVRAETAEEKEWRAVVGQVLGNEAAPPAPAVSGVEAPPPTAAQAAQPRPVLNAIRRRKGAAGVASDEENR